MHEWYIIILFNVTFQTMSLFNQALQFMQGVDVNICPLLIC
ncbi:hypothetical protein HMPREF9430_00090 [Solobacterium moorei F0204]|uniref:Uncharacterized protein n=1 Tax=Solobacterium moorei F0204 TaxID=706433 RepID=E7MKP5_9FIRM|nr:hypothetical protein HMPREF9430_00090 [Solobacterium moorei F0204]